MDIRQTIVLRDQGRGILAKIEAGTATDAEKERLLVILASIALE